MGRKKHTAPSYEFERALFSRPRARARAMRAGRAGERDAIDPFLHTTVGKAGKAYKAGKGGRGGRGGQAGKGCRGGQEGQGGRGGQAGRGGGAPRGADEIGQAPPARTVRMGAPSPRQVARASPNALGRERERESEGQS